MKKEGKNRLALGTTHLLRFCYLWPWLAVTSSRLSGKFEEVTASRRPTTFSG